ncbi:shikimate kinase, partial [Oleiphilus sp. HI0043]
MSIAKPLIVFVGPMGAGKTTIGKILAKELNFDFYDSDKE